MSHEQNKLATTTRLFDEAHTPPSEQASNGIFIVNSEGYFTEIDQQVCDMLGYTREEMLCYSLSDLIPPEELERNPLHVAVVDIGQMLFEERHLLCRNGRFLPVEISIRKLTGGGFLGFIRDLTQRKETELEIRKLAKFPSENPNPVLRVARDGVLLYANQASAGLLKDWNCSVGQCLPNTWYHFIAESLISGRSQEKEMIIGERVYSLFFAPLKEFGYVNVYGYDITQSKRVLKALSESEAQYRRLFEHMLEGFAYCKMIFEGDKPQDFIYIAVNDMFERLTGLRGVVGKRVTEIIPDIQQSDPELFNIYGRVSLTGEPEKFEIFLKALKMWFSVSVYSPEKNYFVAVFDVITERKQAEANLRLTRYTMDNVADAVYWIDSQTRIVDVNQTACHMLGYTHDELAQMTISDIAPNFVITEWPNTWENLKQSNPLILETEHRSKGGRIVPVEIVASYIEYQEQELICVVVRDITERKQAEEARARLEEQLHQAQKMESIGQLAGGVAHDFNNQLTVIQMYSDIIQAKLPDNDPLQKKLKHIQQASQRAANLTKQLLAFSRKQILAPTTINLNNLITNLQKMLEPLIGENITLSTVLEPGLWSIKADKSQIEIVIMNLVTNARDAMPTGGLLTITTENVVLDEYYTRLNLESPIGSCVLLSVADTGQGMDPTIQERIFEPFFTTKRPGDGTGLGLAMVHGIVKQTGGNILVYSKPGQGTMFKIYLPISETGVEVQVVPSIQSGNWHGRETILVAEDEAELRELVVMTLQELGYTILEAPNGKTALSLVGQYTGKIDLLLTDVVMSEGSGRELAETLQAQHPSLKTLFMSGYVDDAVVRHELQKAEIEFLAKPFSLARIASKVREVLDK